MGISGRGGSEAPGAELLDLGRVMKLYDYNPYSLSPRMLQAIGLAISAAGQTESIINQAIAGCIDVDVEYGGAVTTQMSMPLRISVLKSVAEIKINDLDALDALDDLLADIDAAFVRGNIVAHRQWCIDPETGQTFTVRETARTRYEMDVEPVAPEEIEADALALYRSGIRLFGFLKEQNLLPRFPPASRPREHKSKSARRDRRKNCYKQSAL